MKQTRKKLFPVLAAVLLIVMALTFAGSALAYSEAEVGNGEEGFSEEGSNSEEEPKEPPVPEEAPEKSDPPETEENVGVSPDTEPEATGEPVPDEEVKPEASPETSMEPTLIEQEEAVPDAEENAVLMPASIITDGLAANEVMVSSFADLKTGEQWGNYVRRELPEQLEKWFPVQKDIRGRAILGMDTGGYGAFAAAPWYGLAAAVDPLTDLGQLYDTEYCPDPSSLFGARNELRQNGYELDSGFIQPKLEFTSSLMPGSSVEERMETALYTILQRGGGKTWC